jgi:hypothetical protein
VTAAISVASNGWWAQHGAHTLLLAVPAVLIALTALASDVRPWLARHRTSNGRRAQRTPALLLTAAFSLGAAAVHLIVCPQHFKEATIYGLFFAVAASCQAGWAVLALWRPRRWLLAAALAGNSAIVGLWVVTRTVGVPLGPGAGETETIGTLDIIATTCEIGLIVCAVWALTRPVWKRAGSPVPGDLRLTSH